MKHLFGNLFVSLIAGLWMSLKVTQCQTFPTRTARPYIPYCFDRYCFDTYCFNTRSGKTCFTAILAKNRHPVRKPFEEASRLCKVHVPGSSLIIVNSIESQRVSEGFMSTQMLQHEAIIMDARKLSANERYTWSWVNGHPYFPDVSDVSQDARNTPQQFPDGACVMKHGLSLAYCFDSVTSRFGFICENSTVSHRRDSKHYKVHERPETWYDARKNCLESGGDLASIKDLRTTDDWRSYLNENQRYWIGLRRNKWIWKSTGAALTYTNWKNGFPDESTHKQCVCFSPQCSKEKERVWPICETATDRKWRTCDCNNDYAIVCQREEKSNALPTEIVFTEEPSLSTIGTSSATHFVSSSASPSTGLFSWLNTKEILLILVLCVVIVFVVVAVFWIIRKRKYAGRNEESTLKKTKQSEVVSPDYETIVRDNTPSDDILPIYTKLEVTQHPTPSNSTTYASIQPTSETVDMGKSVDYTDIDFPLKDQHKPKSADKRTVSVSPIYSQPFEPSTSDSNTDYLEPYKPDKALTATAPGPSHQEATEQQNVYSLAKAIPLENPNVIYSEPNKAPKASTPTGKAVKDPIYLNVIEVKPGAGSEGVAKQDPSAVYAEPIKLKKSP